MCVLCHLVSTSVTRGASVVPSVPTGWSRMASSIGSKSSGPTQGGLMGGCGQLLASLPQEVGNLGVGLYS